MSGLRGGPTVFPFGRETLLWFRQGGRPDRAGRWLRFLVRWQSFWFERNLALQRRLLPPMSPGTDPVFILGLWRSGTTFLHDLLGACPGMIYPATWQCMSPATFRLRQPPATNKAVARPMDGFTVDTFSPQEDEFALLALGIPSVYRGFFDPRRLDEVSQWLDPGAWVGRSDGWMEAWRDFLAGVADRKTGRLLLKSPNHTFRIRALLEEFPDASYVWLLRYPEETFFSNRKMWVSMFERYAFWKWEAPQLDEFLGRAFMYAAQCLAYAAGIVPKDRLVVVDFDRLTSDPVETIRAVNRRLSLGSWDEMKNAVTRAAANKADYRKDAYPDQPLTPGLMDAIESLRAAQTAALASHGL